MKKATEKRMVLRFRNTHFTEGLATEQKVWMLNSAQADLEDAVVA